MRDLVGYGGQWPTITWPGGRRLAVSVVVNFEEGAELQVGDGDPTSELMGEVISVVEPGVRDMGQEQIFGYGMRAGLWRMLDALNSAHMPATFFLCGRAVERVPSLAAEVIRRGHEPAVHGWRWTPHSTYTNTAEEARDIGRCMSAIQQATGVIPRGFFCRGSESPTTRQILAEQGFLYCSNAFDDDLPYWDRSVFPPLLIVPYALDSNDMKFFHPNGFVRPSEMVDYVESALDVLLAEAEAGKSRLLNIGFHLRIVGRPARFKAFADILALLKRHEANLWVATRADIARAFMAQCPA
ncbi:MAG: polysaccharide deacetylase family protein [Hyphomonadaceae bacterium]